MHLCKLFCAKMSKVDVKQIGTVAKSHKAEDQYSVMNRQIRDQWLLTATLHTKGKLSVLHLFVF